METESLELAPASASINLRPEWVCCVALSFVGLFGCQTSKRQEEWILPEHYVGWLRLDYAVQGAPSLPIEHGRFIVRMPLSGRLQTSTLNNPEQTEYYIQGSEGKRKLRNSWPPAQEYAIQSAYSKGTFARTRFWASVDTKFECAFAGTRVEFKSSGQDCDLWQLGQPQPPVSPNFKPIPDR
jgi:hypothetical protein